MLRPYFFPAARKSYMGIPLIGDPSASSGDSTANYTVTVYMMINPVTKFTPPLTTWTSTGGPDFLFTSFWLTEVITETAMPFCRCEGSGRPFLSLGAHTIFLEAAPSLETFLK